MKMEWSILQESGQSNRIKIQGNRTTLKNQVIGFLKVYKRIIAKKHELFQHLVNFNDPEIDSGAIALPV